MRSIRAWMVHVRQPETEWVTHQLWTLPALVVCEKTEPFVAVTFQEDHTGGRESISVQADIRLRLDCEKMKINHSFVRYLLGGSGNTHSVGLSNFRALCGLIKPVSKLFDWVQRYKLALLKALWTKYTMIHDCSEKTGTNTTSNPSMKTQYQ